MSIFSIADLHLSTVSSKPMDIFGNRWQMYMSKLEKNWRAVVGESDTVIIPGDISWAMKLSEAVHDLKFIDNLPGKKIIGKGNHDLWWTTVSKMQTFLEENDITSISFLHNNAYLVEDYIICGTRGWFTGEKNQNTVGNADYEKLSKRELSRLKLSLDQGMKLAEKSDAKDSRILVYMHFPPVFGDFVCEEMISLMKEYNVLHCYFGHIHGIYNIPRTFVFGGIPLSIISADYLNFTPIITKPTRI